MHEAKNRDELHLPTDAEREPWLVPHIGGSEKYFTDESILH
jgi:hypothetical protein